MYYMLKSCLPTLKQAPNSFLDNSNKLFGGAQYYYSMHAGFAVVKAAVQTKMESKF
jgi:hypothetical protein